MGGIETRRFVLMKNSCNLLQMKSQSYGTLSEDDAQQQDFYLSIPAGRLDNFPNCDSCRYCVQPDVRQTLCLSLSRQSKPLQKQVIFFCNYSSFSKIRFYAHNEHQPIHIRTASRSGRPKL
jgi:hypothetical protein